MSLRGLAAVVGGSSSRIGRTLAPTPVRAAAEVVTVARHSDIRSGGFDDRPEPDPLDRPLGERCRAGCIPPDIRPSASLGQAVLRA